MLLSQMAAEAAKDYKYDIILANVNGKLTEISDMDITDEKVEFITVGETMGNEAYKRSVLLLMLNAIHKLDTDNKIKREMCIRDRSMLAQANQSNQGVLTLLQ